MCKVYFVDDEEWSINELRAIVDWGSLGFEICGFNTDPFEAQEEILSLKPTLVICDIYMDGLSGLQLAQNVYERNAKIEFCFLSAYDKFEYVVTAIKIGAVDYLTKPLKKAELLAVLKKVEKRQSIRSNERFWETALKGNGIDEEMLKQTLLETEGIQIGENSRFIVVRGENSLGAGTQSSTVLFENNEYKIFLENGEGGVDFAQENCWIGIGPSFDKNTISVTALRAAVHCSHQDFLSGKKQTTAYTECEKARAFKDQIGACENKYEMRSLIQSLEKFVRENAINVFDLNVIVKWIISHSLKLGVPFSEELTSKKPVYEKFADFSDMIRELNRIFDEVCERTDNFTINKIVEDIQLHVSEKQSLATYAKQYGYNASYLSWLFKKEMNQSFIEYVISVRITKAKELILTTDKTISEIATLVGYDEYFHFSKIFKENVGLSPTEYRKLHKKKD